MTRDKTFDNIILKNFFRSSVNFFAQHQPFSEAEYLQSYGLASHAWLPLRADLDYLPIATSLKNDLKQLFELAENFFYYVNSVDHAYQSPFMHQKWEEMRQVARRIELAGRYL